LSVILFLFAILLEGRVDLIGRARASANSRSAREVSTPKVGWNSAASDALWRVNIAVGEACAATLPGVMSTQLKSGRPARNDLVGHLFLVVRCR